MSEFRSRRERRLSSSSRIFLLSKLSTLLFFGLIGLVIVTFILFVWYGRDLPAPGRLTDVQGQQSTRIYDKNGILLYSVYKDQNRIYVNLSDIPKDLQHATISVEDKNFYTNPGFSPLSYLSVLRDLLLHGQLRGGSTLTQQLVKNSLLGSNERTISRKIKELILAIQVNQKYSKDQILEMYLNDVPYGGANVGVEAAAESYFGKHVKDLDLAQSALIAGLPQGPTLYDPYNGNKYYLARTKEVLDSMVSNGYIFQKQGDAAYKEVQAMTFSGSTDTSLKAPYYVLYVKQLLAKQFGDDMVENGGLQVYTTLDYNIEKKAEDIVETEISGLKAYNVGNGAAIVMDPKTGGVLAMVGGKGYFDDPKPDGCKPGVNCVFEPNVNLALTKRQPGSSLKPITYATAFEKGYTPATMLMDVKTDFPVNDPKNPIYTPVDYEPIFKGPLQLRFALANSRNVPAVKLLALVGIKDVMQNAYNMGISDWQPTSDNLASVGLSLVLGGRETTLLDEVTAYSVFATGGIKHDPMFITKVTDSKGNVMLQNNPTSGNRVMPEDVTFLISHILLDNVARTMDFGPNSWLVVPGHPSVSVKTGTTDDKKDNWTTGYTPSYVVGVWVGNDNDEPMNQQISSGITGASPIWEKIMSFLLQGKKDEPPTQPSDVIATQVDALFGGKPVDGQPTRSEYFIKGTEPTTMSPDYLKVNDKLYYNVKENDPVSTDGQNRWQAGIDQWIKDNHSAADWQWYPPNQPTPTPTPH